MIATIRSRPLYLIPAVIIGLALLAFIGYFVVYNIYAFALFRFPFDYDQGEGFELVDTILFSRGEWPYRSNDSYPFYSSNYPPVFHIVIVPLVWLFGPHYWTGRLVSYVGTLITAVAIGYAVQRVGRRWWLSLLTGLAFLASNYVYHVGPLFRQHMFMVMLETVAIVLLAVTFDKEEADGRHYNKRILVVMVLLLLAGYTKQLAYATVIATFGFMFLRDWKRALKWAIPFGLATGAVFLLLNIATDGEWFVATVTANVNEFIEGQAIGLYKQWFSLHTVLIVVAVLTVVYELYFSRLSAYAIWFVVAAVNGATAGKWGAGESYFATAIAASCILTGVAFNLVLNKITGSDLAPRRKMWVHMIVLSLIGGLFLVQADKVFHMPTHSPLLRSIAVALGKPTEQWVPPQTSCSADLPPESIPYVDNVAAGLLGRPPNSADIAAGKRIAALVAEGNTPAFSEEAGFNLFIGRDVVTNPTQLLNLYKNDRVDLTDMLAMLDAQAFDTIVFRAQFYPPPVLDVIGQRYVTTDLEQMNGFVYCILRPRNLVATVP